MKNIFTISAKVRSNIGKGASRRLRRADQVPGIVYGGGKDPMSITVDHNLLQQSLAHESFYTKILDLDLDGGNEKVVLRDLQRHPYKPAILHFDLQRINPNEALVMNIPLRFIGAEVSPAVKIGGALVSHLEVDIEIRCLPKDLPEFIEVDLSALEVGQTIHLSDLKLPEGVALVHDVEAEDKAIVTAYVLKAAATEETEAPVATEVPVVGDEKAKIADAGDKK